MKSTLSSLARRLKDSTFVIVVAVVLLAAGTATAAKLITGKDIKDHSITGKDIKKGSLPLSVLKGTASDRPAGPERGNRNRRSEGLDRSRRAPRRSPKSFRWAARSRPRSLRAAR